MKNFIFLLFFCVLFQSCYSYKAKGYNNYNEKNQKIQIVTLSKSIIRGQLVSKKENEILIVSNKNGQILTIPHSEIESFDVRKFSFLKTLGLVGLIGAPPFLILVFTIFK